MKPIIPLFLLSFMSCQKTVSTNYHTSEPEILRFEPEVSTIDNQHSIVSQQRILVVGDSEACFVSRRFNDIRQQNESIELECKGGTTIQYWAEGGNFHKALLKHPKPDAVIIFLGTNNYWNNKLPNTSLILDEIKNSKTRCIWVGPTAVKGKHWQINQLLKQNVAGVCDYVDTESLNIPLEDGVHPTHEGILKWLKAIWGAK